MNKTLGNLFKGDKGVWMIFFILSIVSLVEVFSASSFLTYKGGSYWSPMIKHSGILLFGLFCMIVTLNIKCKYFKLLTPFLLMLSFILLVWVLLAGNATNDAHRWVSFFGLQFQPSEIAKGCMVLVTAQILAATQTDEGADRHAFWWIIGICAPMIVLILLENFSTAALISVTIFAMMCVGRVPMKQLGALFSVGVIVIVLAFTFIMLVGDTDEVNRPTEVAQTEITVDSETVGAKKESSFHKIFHRASLWKQRVLDFASNEQVPPEKVDLEGKGAQVAYSNIAIASSRVIGVGPGNSEERDFLSQAFSDFIFAIIIEELGIAGALLVVFCYVALLFRVGKISDKCENNFPAFFAMGLALMLVIQAMFNMCVAVGLVPVTGQPLPLISKGGTSTVINCIYIGAILSISRSAKKRDGSVGKSKVQTVAAE